MNNFQWGGNTYKVVGLLCLLISSLALGSAEEIRINCGGWHEPVTASDGKRWEQDRHFSLGQLSYNVGNISTPDWKIYGSGRSGLFTDFHYDIPVSNGDYRLTLKFAELQGRRVGYRIFDVLVNGTKVLNRYDIAAKAGPGNVIDESIGIKVTNGRVRIDFVGVVGRGAVSAIELIPTSGSVNPGDLRIDPLNATVTAGGTRKFDAYFGTSPAQNVSWSILNADASSGTIDGSGLYRAPAVVNSNRQVTVRGVSGGKVAESKVELKSNVSLKIVPAETGLVSGASVLFKAEVTGTSDARVNWTTSAGSIQDNGQFVAPQVSGPTNVTVKATSVADPSVSASALVKVTTAGAGPVSYRETNGTVVIEAENGEIVNRNSKFWNRRTSVSGYSGTGYVIGEPNSGTNYTANFAGSAPEIQYRVTFSTPGTYFIWIRGFAPTYADDSIHIGLNGSPLATGTHITEFSVGTNIWSWSNRIYNTATRASLTIPSAGSYIINAWMREDGFLFDKIVLSRDAGYVPSGIGPAESPTDAAGGAALSVGPGSLSFSGMVGGSSPLAQSLSISNQVSGSLVWTATKSASWISISTASGSTPGAVSVSVNPTGLAAGTHSGSVTVSAPGAANSPVTIPVQFTLASGVAVPAPAPALSTSPSALSYSMTAGSGAPSNQQIQISNGGGTLGWTAASAQNWITLSATSGTAPSNLSVGISAGGLAAGTYSGSVVITAAGASGSPQTIPVSLTVAAAQSAPGGANQFFVSPTGKPSGNGSISNPWDLATALNHPSAVKPGATIWMRGGTYGSGGPVTSRLTGTASNPIVLRQYPGERATLNGSLVIRAPHTWFWGFEVTAIPRSTGSDCVSTYENSHGTRLINMVIHDCGSNGVGYWRWAENSEIYGTLIYYNGSPGPTRGHGHGIYLQTFDNGAGKVVSDNIIFKGLGFGIQAYGSGSTFVRNVKFDGNIIFEPGVLYGKRVDGLIVTVGSGAEDITVENNHIYMKPGMNQGYSRLGWLFSGTEKSVIARNNHFMGGESAAELWHWNRAEFTGNTVYSPSMLMMTLNLRSGQSLSNYNLRNNTYYGSGIYRHQTKNSNLGSVQALGIEQGSRYISGKPSGVWTFVRPNKYEQGRANIVVYNWAMENSVSVNLSGVLAPGTRYEVRDAQNFYSAPVTSGTYSGGSISIPMTRTTVAPTVGSVPIPPSHTGPEFGAFVLLPLP
ncbi:MAG: malectin domain-containing carbohydrate-binding protein [Bryobacteraceae bacterium]